ncbi:hypothetical protein V9T40_010542 [Parthenolecanium corni]|uniref:Uncharacterized protein n=1 Tax=Parthenolecanium corni TaxID=536013 RepID=A0AAN9T5E5_9HEMI
MSVHSYVMSCHVVMYIRVYDRSCYTCVSAAGSSYGIASLRNDEATVRNTAYSDTAKGPDGGKRITRALLPTPRERGLRLAAYGTHCTRRHPRSVIRDPRSALSVRSTMTRWLQFCHVDHLRFLECDECDECDECECRIRAFTITSTSMHVSTILSGTPLLAASTIRLRDGVRCSSPLHSSTPRSPSVFKQPQSPPLHPRLTRPRLPAITFVEYLGSRLSENKDVNTRQKIRIRESSLQDANHEAWSVARSRVQHYRSEQHGAKQSQVCARGTLLGKTAEQTETDGAAENYDILEMTFSAVSVSVSVSVNRSRQKWRPLVGIQGEDAAGEQVKCIIHDCGSSSSSNCECCLFRSASGPSHKPSRQVSWQRVAYPYSYIHIQVSYSADDAYPAPAPPRPAQPSPAQARPGRVPRLSFRLQIYVVEKTKRRGGGG